MTDGLVIVDKGPGWTSHDVVAKCRGIFGQRRIGHSGTLDPPATGLLLLGLGRATRLLRFLTDLPKSYEGEIVLGVTTSTLDAEGEVTGRWDMGAVSMREISEAAKGFVGPIEQVPPMVSAVKVGGRRLHELARAGVEVAREPRPVVVHRLEVAATADPGVVRVEVDCSSGTYVRTLAADLGTALGGGAHLRALRRTGIGSFGLSEARPIEVLSPADVLPPAEAMRDYARVRVEGELVAAIAHGRVLGRDELGVSGDGPWGLLDPDGRLVAVYEDVDGSRVKPAVVLVV